MKRTAILLLVITILLVITGCGSNDISNVESTNTEETVNVVETYNVSSETEEETIETENPTYVNDWVWAGEQLSPENPTVEGPSGTENFFNEDVTEMMENMKGTSYESNYWVREDGIKMYGKYIICKSKLEQETTKHPYSPIGEVIPTTVGLAIVCSNDTDKDVEIAVTW